MKQHIIIIIIVINLTSEQKVHKLPYTPLTLKMHHILGKREFCL